MCEQFVARSPEPFAIADLWEFAGRLERFGIAGFGWGAAWLTAEGRLAVHRDVRAFRDDPGREVVGREVTTSLLVHLRRPSKLSTIAMPDTQPFEDPRGRFAFSHNGDLRDHRTWRDRYGAQGRIHGRADSEVAARWLEDEWDPALPPGLAFDALHDVLGGAANFALLLPDGTAHHYAGNPENPVFAFRIGPIRFLSTGIYSLDRSLFHLVCPDARDRRAVRLGRTASLA